MSTGRGTYNSMTGTFVDVREFGADRTDADCTTAFQQAANVAAASGGVMFIPAGTWTLTGTVTIQPGVEVRGAGAGTTTISHTGNGVCLDFDLNGSYTVVNAVRDLQIIGNSGGNGVGVRVSDTWGFKAHNIVIRDYTAGIGFQLYNDANWTEGTEAIGVRIRNCAVGVSFTRSAASAYDSFGYTRFLNMGINVPASGVGIRFGDSLLAGTHYIYHSEFHVNFWLGTSGTAIGFDGDTAGEFNQMFVTGEKESGATSTRQWSSQAPSDWRYTGVVRVAADTVTAPANTYMNVHVNTVPDRAALTLRAASGQSAQVLSVESSAASMTAAIYDFGAVAGTYLVLGADLSSPTYISRGTGTPEGAVTGRVGDLFIRLDGGASTTLYVKESGSGNTGWIAK